MTVCSKIPNIPSSEEFFKCDSRGYRENFWRAKIYAVQGLFSTAQGERNFVQNEGRNSLSQEHTSNISEPLLIFFKKFFLPPLEAQGVRNVKF